MQSDFDKALALLLREEGGRVDDPRDPGGRTNKGITQATYDGWRAKKGLAKRDVYDISDDDVSAIYRAEYADRLRFDDLPPGLAYAVLDYGVNSGVGRAARALQACLAVSVDGVIGSQTVAAAKACDRPRAVNGLCDSRLTMLHGLSTWPTYGKGWASRVARVRAAALAWAPAPVASVQIETPSTTPKSSIPVSTFPSPTMAGPHILPAPATQSWGDWLKGLFFARPVA